VDECKPLDSGAAAAALLAPGCCCVGLGRAVQVDSIKIRVESACGFSA